MPSFSQDFTSSGSWTAPAGAMNVVATAQGLGADGGLGNAADPADGPLGGGGGGGGGKGVKNLGAFVGTINFTIGTDAVTDVGAEGYGGSSASGTLGGAGGGYLGDWGTAGSPGGNAVSTTGGAGGNSGSGAAGGSAPLHNASGNNGDNYGGGGSGASGWGTGAAPSWVDDGVSRPGVGSGGAAKVTITWDVGVPIGIGVGGRWFNCDCPDCETLPTDGDTRTHGPVLCAACDPNSIPGVLFLTVVYDTTEIGGSCNRTDTFRLVYDDALGCWRSTVKYLSGVSYYIELFCDFVSCADQLMLILGDGDSTTGPDSPEMACFLAYLSTIAHCGTLASCSPFSWSGERHNPHATWTVTE